jgi:hypothetical protein
MDFNKTAGSLQEFSRERENLKEKAGIDYSEQRVRISTVHTREDIILIYSQINSMNEQIYEIKAYTKTIALYVKLSFYIALLFAIKNLFV